MTTVTYSDDNFLAYFDSLCRDAVEHSYFDVRWSYFHGNGLFKGGDDWERNFSEWRILLKNIVETLQSAATRVVICGHKFNDDSFYGQGRVARKFIEKAGPTYVIDFGLDIISGCEFFWGGTDNQKPPSNPGEVYFFLNPGLINWEKLFALSRNPCVVPNLGASSYSVSCHKNALNYVKNEINAAVVRFDRSHLHVYADSDYISRLVRHASINCFVDNESGTLFVTPTPPQELLRVYRPVSPVE